MLSPHSLHPAVAVAKRKRGLLGSASEGFLRSTLWTYRGAEPASPQRRSRP